MIRGILFDRDGTIVHDVPYNGDPNLVEPVPHAKELLDELRARGFRVGILTNQSGVGRGMITLEQMNAVNARVEELLGPFDGWFVCPHAPDDDCECRKPKPKLIFDAARRWSLSPNDIAVVGDRQSDLDVARNAGTTGFLVTKQHDLRQIIMQML